MRSPQRLVLGTRGSALARAQTEMVEQGLRSAWPDLAIAVEIVTTRGDQRSERYQTPVDRRAGRKGIFTAEIERALLARQIDVAVHSAKDLPSEPTAGLQICAVLPRAAVEDVLIAKEARDLTALPDGAVIATGSVRRQHQLRLVRPDLALVDLRGNVPTRLRKLTENSWAGIILARAGLERLGYDCARKSIRFDDVQLRTSVLSIDDFVPAGGQGIVALQVRGDDADSQRLLAPLNDAAAMLCLRAERQFLRLLQGDCGTPVGVLATTSGGAMTARAQVFDDTGGKPRRATHQGHLTRESPEAIGARLLELING